MPYKIYVGNYPNSFVEDDVLNLFQDFEGVELAGFFKTKQKCYSFLFCLDMRQLVEIITNLHDIDVCGRNLIVRAADQNLHKRIQKSISENRAVNYHPKNTCDSYNSSFANGNNRTYTSEESQHSNQSLAQQTVTSEHKDTSGNRYKKGDNTYHSAATNSYNNARRITKKNAEISNNYDYSSCSSDFNHSSQMNTSSEQPCASADERSSYYQSRSESERENHVVAFDPQETFTKLAKPKTDASDHYKSMSDRFDSYKSKSKHDGEKSPHATHIRGEPRGRNASESSLETVHNIPSTEEYAELSYVSILNFPLRLPARDLYELFADFQPIKVFMVCNEPRKVRTPTEAIICFENEKNATEAILTLDNTVYGGRIILVTDAVDQSIVSELLSFGHDKNSRKPLATP